MNKPADQQSRGTDASAEQPQDAKAIVLFSDGTGNSSAKLFKTNVWRTYEAVDLGPAAPGKRPQISYYDDGVGTSSFAPLAALGGAFGWGLKRNVLDIYRYACRNYRTNDDIYAFGFSRGAFTIRLVVALIASEGLVPSENEAELRRRSVAAYRRFRKELLPRRLAWPTKLSRRLRDGLLRAWHRDYDSSQNFRPHIRFVGVWDTVAAYGGPIVEVTRAVDNWFFPLSMPDYKLHDRVQCARQALAIDDERDAFQPLLWDEVHEAARIEAGAVAADRLQQVWFTGTHADVGGGYPDESLSYVSLLWMMEQAEQAGLRTLSVIKDRFVALASSSGPIHDSRSGVGAYYRYQPRKIAAWLEPTDAQTLSLRDPAITDDRGRSRGLLRAVHVHESVVNRIGRGTDRYAPIALPETFEIVPPEQQGERAPQADSEPVPPRSPQRVVKPMIDPAVRARFRGDDGGTARRAALEGVWDLVWWRRITYFVTLAATLLLVALPALVQRLPTPPVLSDGRTWIGGIIRLLTLVLPAFAGQWINVYADNPFYFIVLAGVIALLLVVSDRLERALRDEARHIWRLTLGGGTLQPRMSWVQRFKNSRSYQRSMQWFKWYVLPDGVITPLMVLGLAYVLFGAYVQARLPFLENGTTLCRPSASLVTDVVRVSRDFRARDLCSDSFGVVHEGERYVVTMHAADPWYDSTLATSPHGLSESEFPWALGYVAVPLKRVIGANYLQPLLEIRPVGRRTVLGGNVQIYPLPMQQVGDSRDTFRGEFRAARTGELFLFVNDAMLPFTTPIWGFDYRYFYERAGDAAQPGNRGTACVTVESDDGARGAGAQAGLDCAGAGASGGQ
jgi:uncharacterized protein (DUF2235 family)